MPLVFQYGSNTNAERLNAPTRLNGAAIDRGPAQTVGKFEIAFNKWSKGNQCAAADLIECKNGGRRIWGVLYQMTEENLEKLAKKIEGASYKEKDIEVVNADETKTAKTFVVRGEKRRQGLGTSAKYVGHIVKGLRDQKVPDCYIQYVIDVAIETNQHPGKVASEEAQRIRALRTQPA